MPDAALVFAAVVLCGAVVLACRARLSAADQLLAGNREAIERERVEWRLDRAALVEAQLKREERWHTERRELLTRIQAPDLAIGEAYAEADEERRTQAKGQPRETRAINFRSEDLEARAEHVLEAQRALESMGISFEDVAAGAEAARADVAS